MPARHIDMSAQAGGQLLTTCRAAGAHLKVAEHTLGLGSRGECEDMLWVLLQCCVTIAFRSL